VLVLAVPVEECAAAEQIATGVAAVAGTLCPAATIRVGYAGDGPASLPALLSSIVSERAAAPADEPGVCPYAAVVVPLTIAPDPGPDARIADAAGQAGPAVTVTDPLGPHPLLAGALHDRLAEAGLVQARRMSGLSLVSTAIGLLIGTAGGEPALRAAETVAVLLAGRLGVPIAAVSLRSRDSLDGGVARLRQAGISHLALAPYILGSEISPQELAAAAAAAGADCAPPLGAHPALGQLATMRYGAALLGQAAPDPAAAAPPTSAPGAPGQEAYLTTPPATDPRNLPWRTSTSR
jgi:sirohydrochlorin ferrochelatase